VNSETTNRKSNRLVREKSPYLLQHAHNPVDWYPWGSEAFERARVEDKPVFVSIGYSTCHWCHVMAEECFNDEETAELMNKAFVCIKVDREERPDIDGAYMAVCQHMGRSCGWPLNIVMTPNKKPFFAVSYVPKQSRFGLIGMMDLIPQIEQIWATRRNDLENMGTDIIRSVEKSEGNHSESELGMEVLESAFEWFSQNFDEDNGGFGFAPKFPSPHNLLFLLRYWNRTKDKVAMAMVEKTLSAMRMGGIFDQVGFGFHRYSTDAEWRVPHFEKMLYDQALLTLAYIEAYQATGMEEFKVTAKEVLEYIVRDMLSPEGGFYSAQDADSEGEEGKFYLWSEDEIRRTLPPEDADIAIKIFGIQSDGNYNPNKKLGGTNILQLEKTMESTALELRIEVEELSRKLVHIRSVLFEARDRRIHPSRDDKILTDWNGLVIAALAKAGQVFADPKYLQAAVKTSDFVMSKMRKEKTILHSYAKGRSEIEGFLDDYAFLVWGLIEIYEANFDDNILRTAVDLTRIMIDRFWDEKNGGFYFTAKDAADVILRRKEAYDGALPSGNSVSLLNLLRLGRLTGSPSFEEMASRMFKVFADEIKRAPAAHSFTLVGLEFITGPTFNVVIVGETHEKSTSEMLEALRRYFLPGLLISMHKPSANDKAYEEIEGQVTAYVCHGQTCMPPTNNVSKMLELLGLASAGD
jgi:uncharacterized protein YyaL (SSP411 family)